MLGSAKTNFPLLTFNLKGRFFSINQIGRGSLIIELEVDTREEVGRVEEVSLMPTFTLHTTEKSWSEAESDCSFTVYVKGASPFVK